MKTLDSLLKSRDIAWQTKVPIVKAMVFPIVMYRCESWSIMKAKLQKIKSDTVSTVSPSISHEVMGPDSREGAQLHHQQKIGLKIY